MSGVGDLAVVDAEFDRGGAGKFLAVEAHRTRRGVTQKVTIEWCVLFDEVLPNPHQIVDVVEVERDVVEKWRCVSPSASAGAA